MEEFGRDFDRCYSFVGLIPDEHTTAKQQLEEFSRQIAREFKTAFAHYQDWSDALFAIGERVQSGKILLFFDEISWMGSEDPTFLGKIKNFWDTQLKKNDRLIFVVCGSAASWIEKNILANTGFVGRVSYTLTLEPLTLEECNAFWPKNIAAHEKFKVLAVTGGIPKYLEEMDLKKSSEENIKNLCFTKGGFLVDEFEKIFSDIFNRKSQFYKRIVRALADGPKEQAQIIKILNDTKHLGRISEYLEELELAGFVRRDHTWNLKTGQDLQLSKYRLSDNYLRFYLKYIEKNLSKIERNTFAIKSLTMLPEWPSMMGFQFENLVLNNRHLLYRLLNIQANEIVSENPFFQRKTLKTAGCQIDYMIQTKFGTLYIFEIKFLKSEITASIIPEVEQKIQALALPKGISCRPVLIHVNGVVDAVKEEIYFSEIIDFGALLEY